MQVTLDAFALKPFTKALNCLSRYGDELVLYATPDYLSFSTTNSSKSAYCRFKYDKQFFSRYTVGAPNNAAIWAGGVQGALTATGQLLTKSLLSILKHRTVEKSVERCEMTLVEGAEAPASHDNTEETFDSLESQLIVRMHCKHGVVKTHRLVLLTSVALMAPSAPDSVDESRLTVGPRALKDMIEHFALARGGKSDSQLVWNFAEAEVNLKSLEHSAEPKGMAQLSTELIISADEFELYDIQSPPIVLVFHLREFNASVAYADSMVLSMEMRFTESAAPLFIDVEGDSVKALFVISTSQMSGGTVGNEESKRPPSSKSRKRGRDEGSVERTKIKRAAPVAHIVRPSDVNAVPSGSPNALREAGIPPLPSQIMHSSTNTREDPLFLPSLSQVSAREGMMGLGLDDMNPQDVQEMLEDEGEEVLPNQTQQSILYDSQALNTSGKLIQTQGPPDSPNQHFLPLFED